MQFTCSRLLVTCRALLVQRRSRHLMCIEKGGEQLPLNHGTTMVWEVWKSLFDKQCTVRPRAVSRPQSRMRTGAVSNLQRTLDGGCKKGAGGQSLRMKSQRNQLRTPAQPVRKYTGSLARFAACASSGCSSCAVVSRSVAGCGASTHRAPKLLERSAAHGRTCAGDVRVSSAASDVLSEEEQARVDELQVRACCHHPHTHDVVVEPFR